MTDSDSEVRQRRAAHAVAWKAQQAERQAVINRAEELLGYAREKFQAASQAADDLLAVATDEWRDGAPRHVTLQWTFNSPLRHAKLAMFPIRGYLEWELRGDFNQLGVYEPGPELSGGIAKATDLTEAHVDALIFALFDQEAWGNGRVPDVRLPDIDRRA